MSLIPLQAYADRRICVAVSGGADSVCLLHCLLTGAEEFHITLTALTCEHGIRGQESERDLHFVEELCAKWQVPLTVFRADVPARAKAHRRGLEEEARLFRYECFESVLKNGLADAVATAHHQNDLAETVLFRLTRGTSLTGLNAIREGKGILRPLLGVSRADIEGYIKEHGLSYVTDSSNADVRYARNAIRHTVLPALEGVSEGACRHIAEFASRAKEDDDFLFSLAVREVERIGSARRVPVSLALPVFSRACLLAMKELGCERDYSAVNLQDVGQLKTLQSGKSIALRAGLLAVREGEFVTLYCPQPVPSALSFREGEWAFGEYTVAIRKGSEGSGLYLDGAALPEDAVIRVRSEGDRFTPFKGKEKSLKEYLTDKKIPARIGHLLPVLAVGEEVYAVFGVEISDRVKVTPKTEERVWLSLSPPVLK